MYPHLRMWDIFTVQTGTASVVEPEPSFLAGAGAGNKEAAPVPVLTYTVIFKEKN